MQKYSCFLWVRCKSNPWDAQGASICTTVDFDCGAPAESVDETLCWVVDRTLAWIDDWTFSWAYCFVTSTIVSTNIYL